MDYVIGTDEAGYGPNLGPLVISATLWRLPEGVEAHELYERLGACIGAEPDRSGDCGRARLWVADSKVVYRSGKRLAGKGLAGKGLGHLERGVLVCLAILGRRPASFGQVWDALGADRKGARHGIPWYADCDYPLPREADPAEIEASIRSVKEGLAAAEVGLVEVRSRAIFPEEFNAIVEQEGSKGAVLSRATLGLVAELLEPVDEGRVTVVCDKHGGRNRYGPLLAEHFPEWLIEIRGEGREKSVYQFGPRQRRVEIRFQTKAESYLPVALGSMVSKYARELAVDALNDFWTARVAGLRRTAGYPQDAKRFRAEIGAVQKELGIEDRVLWRRK